MTTVIEHQLDPVIYSHQLLDLYASCNQDISIHLKFNTGMNRYGFNADELDDIIVKLKNNPHLHIASVCSHLSSSNNPSKDELSKKQMKTFDTIRFRLEKEFAKTLPYHLMNSNGAIRFTVTSNEWVRMGIALYGGMEHPNLTQIFSLKSVISQTRYIQKGESVGYQNSFVAEKNMQIGIVPVGYADGLNRKLGQQNGQVFIKDTACRIIGDISMDSFATDISDLEVSEGQEVVIFSPKYSVSQLAHDLDTIPYEIMATLNRRIKRIYLKE